MNVDDHEMRAVEQIAQIVRQVGAPGDETVLVARRDHLDSRDQSPLVLDIDRRLGIERRHGDLFVGLVVTASVPPTAVAASSGPGSEDHESHSHIGALDRYSDGQQRGGIDVARNPAGSRGFTHRKISVIQR